MPPTSPLIRMRGVRKRFGPVDVLRGVDLDITAGRTHVLAGENGAGKSTLLRILCGALGADGGTIEINGRLAAPRSPQEASRLGVAMIHQELSLVPSMSVPDNVLLGAHRTRFGFVDRRASDAAARAALAALELGAIDLSRCAGDLPIAQQQLVEIAKAVGRSASVIIMDEPTSALPAPDAQRLFRLIASLVAGGRAVIYVTHRMEEIQRLADDITVLRDGAVAASGPAGAFSEERLIETMLGRTIERSRAPAHANHGPLRLVVEDLHVTPQRGAAIRGVSFSVRAGEILGVAGLQGSGCSTLLMGLFGAHGSPPRGVVTLDGVRVTLGDPRAAVAHGIACLPNDRKAAALVPAMSIEANLTLASLRGCANRGWRRPRIERELAAQAAARMRLSGAPLSAPVTSLSGGNQQKVVLGRWLLTRPRVLLLDEPTRGIDIGARQEIYSLLRRCAADGIAILMASSDLPELLELSDRILVLHRGRAVRLFDRAGATQEAVLAASMGAAGGEAA